MRALSGAGGGDAHLAAVREGDASPVGPPDKKNVFFQRLL